MSENQKIAEQVVEAVGGRENIVSFAHCATRLRIMVRDKELIDQKRTESIDKVKGAFFNSGQYQIIFGTGTVNRIFEEVERLGIESTSKENLKQEGKKAGNSLQRAIRTFGDVFVPIIPVLVATGLFMGLRGLLTQPQILSLFGAVPEDISPNFLLFTQILTDTAFAFLPALVAWSAFRVFGGSPVLGIVLGLMLVNPALPNAYAVAGGTAEPLTFLGFIPVVGYQGSVLPAFFIGLLGAKLEKLLRKRIPEALDLILTPFLTLLIMITLGLFAIGPVFHSLETVVLNGTTYLLGLPFGIAGLLIGFFQQIVVVTGVHHIFNFLEIQLLEKTGSNPFNAIITCAMAAQGAACLAVGLKTKNLKLKALALPSSLSAFLGITEPAIFGVNLRYMKPFIMGLVGGAVGGFLASLVQLSATGMAITVIPGTLLYMNGQLPLYILCNLTAMAVSFVLTWMFGYRDAVSEGPEELPVAETGRAPGAGAAAQASGDTAGQAAEPTKVPIFAKDRAALADAPGTLSLLSPISGTLVDLGQVPDPAFAEKQMGDGIAIQPDEGKVYAPFDAVVAHVMEKSKHAVILEHVSGVQVLIHVGIDTVALKGEGFTLNVHTGDQVKAGQLLIEFDPETIRRAGLSTVTPVIIPNGIEGVLDFSIASSGNVTAAADRIMKVNYAVANHA
ncbi:PTS system sucrose-specific IIA component, Glc family (TC 4.A.1.2.12)/PTS system sucrose-specific IIB component, Glc family (TC 4.A.1.2.12)/PTS system sucrose-specific IIC component, Glc family (TC 4.A.1.2.12) [Paenibacillus sophorae]|uniref:PTS system sucrose-specific IIA component, Glc family (TC 4.A.1.2.12)/PTS system sucrose-specific IIB component, Glc family (TC 4.A.1.2.12)/PTS system sucrose-specific IIC component, Glc family (TC... n=1 Tax=Paenibacillus sophorae TaxID=1333845 RepID=A0A1H8RAI0_9BACL|nr:sucrose-specific PTS transporter subunit IIBC [Paenibacillus sophorae]QWU15012.1 sucrose-specific PTS transporter subunit IIBC [Paenibacillus sophorae]SEO63382.1 PTS system sucrose-specific IIA component, Glc family (TC 4.A.1.2.12)/PTS system sucrose-specific IIB component, Glc family (TC 4.A.1.2.12)/PTS system sucrose-specific IIC component, Glc family (TC 4.A.1.2.12) [Paenibacillus sophorae]